MDNIFNRKLAESAARRTALYLRLHKKGMTEAQIGKRYGITRQRVNQILKKARGIDV